MHWDSPWLKKERPRGAGSGSGSSRAEWGLLGPCEAE